MNSLERLKDCGLLGCLNDTDITSENYKEKLSEMMEEKYQDRERSKREDQYICEKCGRDDVIIETTSWDKKRRRKCIECGALNTTVMP